MRPWRFEGVHIVAVGAVVAVVALAGCGGDVHAPRGPGHPGDPVSPDPNACEPGVTCHDTVPSTISGTTVGGTRDFATYSCSGADESGPERIHRIPIASAGLLHVELDDSAAEANVDVHILSSFDASACLDGGVPDATAHVEPPFAYVVFDTWVDATGNALAGPFTASLTFPYVAPTNPPPPPPPPPPSCPDGVTCVDALPFTATGTTVGGTTQFASYACAPGTDESGPERIFRVALPGGTGTLSVALDETLEAGATDVDVQILSADDANQCLARNDRAASAVVSGTEAWVVLDSFVRADGSSGAGSFSASFTFTPSTPVDPTDPGAVVLVNAGVPPVVAALAIHAYNSAKAQDLTSSPIFSVVDFELPSYEKRLWIVNLETGALLVNDRVAHGSGSQDPSDPAMAATFSNVSGSNQSSLGLVRTAETYDGTHPYSLRLDGLEDSNSNMRDRLIVMHGATYAEDDFVNQNGYLGRSNGCFAVAQSREVSIVDIVKEGTLLWAYYPDPAFLASSPFLQ